MALDFLAFAFSSFFATFLAVFIAPAAETHAALAFLDASSPTAASLLSPRSSSCSRISLHTFAVFFATFLAAFFSAFSFVTTFFASFLFAAAFARFLAAFFSAFFAFAFSLRTTRSARLASLAFVLALTILALFLRSFLLAFLALRLDRRRAFFDACMSLRAASLARAFERNCFFISRSTAFRTDALRSASSAFNLSCVCAFSRRAIEAFREA